MKDDEGNELSPRAGLDDEWLMDDFESHWQRKVEPSIKEFLDRATRGGLPPIKTLVELVRIDLEYRMTRDEVDDRFVEDYQAEFPDLPIDAELVGDELRLRCRRGERMDRKDWLDRFPREQFVDETEYDLFVGLFDEQSDLSSDCLDSKSIRYDQQLQREITKLVGATEFAESDDDYWPPLGIRYERRELLGRGGFGVVWEALDRRLQRAVAIKLLLNQQGRPLSDEKISIEEARAAAKLDHPNLMTIHDVIVGDGFVALVMQLVDGVPMDDWWDSLTGAGNDLVSRSHYRELAKLFATICSAVHHAHLAGLVHCDLKPANILVTSSNCPMVLDFGLAVQRDHQDSLVGQVLGTPSFMSPEQTWGDAHQIDGRSDIWSLGVIFFRLLTGEAPFTGSTHASIFEAIQTRDPIPVGQFRDGIPKELIKICRRCLQKRVDDRFETAREVADAFQAFTDQCDRGDRPVSDETVVMPNESSRYRFDSSDSYRQKPNLPWRTTELVGRQRVIDEVSELLSGPGRLVTLTGVGGIGKTEAAIAVAGKLAEASKSEVVWVDLSMVNDVHQFSATVLSALNVSPQHQASSSDLVSQAVFVRGPVLLVLDNLEQIADVAASVVVSWLDQCPALKTLVTSQIPLRVAGEVVKQLVPLSVEPSGDAVELFTNRAQLVNGNFQLSEHNLSDVSEICRLVDGNPLAIELAAARLGVMTLSDLKNRLVRSFNVLRNDRTDRPARHKTLLEVVRWSFDLLDTSHQEALVTLATWPAPMQRDLAEQIVDDGKIDPLDMLDELRQRQLIRVEANSEPVQVSTSIVVQRFVSEVYQSLQNQDRSESFIDSALDCEPTSAKMAVGLGVNLWVAAERLIEATKLIDQPSPALLRKIASACLKADQLAGSHWDSNVRIQRLSKCSDFGDDIQKVEICLCLADAKRKAGSTDQAAALVTDSLNDLDRLRRGTGRPTFNANDSECIVVAQQRGRRLLAAILFRAGKSEEAIEALETELRDLDRQNDRGLTVDVLLELAEYQRRIGQVVLAEDLLKTCQQMMVVQPSDGHSRSGPLKNHRIQLTVQQGKLALQRGSVAEASEMFGEAVRLADQMDDEYGRQQALLGRAATRAELGDFAGAEKDYSRTERLSRLMADLPTLAQTINNRALAYADSGQCERCCETLDEALLLYRQIGDSVGVAICLVANAAAQLQLNRPEEAVGLLGLTDVCDAIPPNSIHEAIRLGELGLAQSKLGRLTDACQSLQQCVKKMDQLGIGQSADRFLYTTGYLGVLSELQDKRAEDVRNEVLALAKVCRSGSIHRKRVHDVLRQMDLA